MKKKTRSKYVKQDLKEKFLILRIFRMEKLVINLDSRNITAEQ